VGVQSLLVSYHVNPQHTQIQVDQAQDVVVVVGTGLHHASSASLEELV
jgi:hypothetical protein